MWSELYGEVSVRDGNEVGVDAGVWWRWRAGG